MARAPVPAVAAAAGAAYLAALLALDHYADYHEQLALGVLTFAVLFAALTRVSVERRAQTLAVVGFATIGEVTGSLIWGVYHYRLHNLPLFIPPAHGLVYLTALSLAVALRRHTRALVTTAAVAAATWGVLGLAVLPRQDVAGALGVPLLLVFLLRSRNRADLRVGVPRRRRARALRHGDRDLALGGAAPGPRHPGRQPAERRRLGLRLVRRDGAARRAVPRRPHSTIEQRPER